MNTARRVVSLACILGFVAACAAAPGSDRSANALDKLLPPDKGLCAVLGDADGGALLALARGRPGLTFYSQVSDDAQLAAVRAAAADRFPEGLLGTRAWVERGKLSSVHLGSDLADVVWLAGAAVKETPRAEIVRILRPGGVVIIDGGKEIARSDIAKGVPDGVDYWPHPYHGPDNNPLSQDKVALAPYLTQFLATPWYGPQPEQTVTAGGRLFKLMGNWANKDRESALVYTLICMNAYNGTVLWTRPAKAGYMIHRNTMLATPGVLYLADNESCKRIDAATGKTIDEIAPPADVAGGTIWNWMAIDGDVLYAMIGDKEPDCPAKHTHADWGGWGWNDVTGYYSKTGHQWGFGKTILAIDLKAGSKVLWTVKEKSPIDSRAMCMKGGWIYYYSPDAFLACIDAKDGKEAWRTTDAKLLAAIGKDGWPQEPSTGYAGTAYVKCTDDALYFAGPQRPWLVAVSAKDGSMLWTSPNGNYQLVIRPEALYAVHSRQQSQKLDLLTGRVLSRLPGARTNCTRVTGSADSIFARALGTGRWDVKTLAYEHLSGFRPNCNDGVVISNGMLYWGPWMCDCNFPLAGVQCVRPAGDFDIAAKASDEGRLEIAASAPRAAQAAESPADWPTYRKDNARSAVTSAEIPEKVTLKWTAKIGDATPSSHGRNRVASPVSDVTPPVATGGKVFVGDSAGVVTCLDARDGKEIWRTLTGGAIKQPPTIAKGRAYVGSADGWVYCLDAAAGKLVWRFRAAPAEQMIPVYGQLSSRWPVNSGVAVQDGVAYAAAGIVHHDGTHVYALDAATGKLKWHSTAAKRDDPAAAVCAQGDLLIHGGKLHLAGGNVVSPATYNLADGRFEKGAGGGGWDKTTTGKELCLSGGRVVSSGPLLYSPDECPLWRPTIHELTDGVITITASKDRKKPAGNPTSIVCVESPARAGRQAATAPHASQPATGPAAPKVFWDFRGPTQVYGMAMTPKALLMLGETITRGQPSKFTLSAISTIDGQEMWSHDLPAMPKFYGLAIDAAGQVYVSLKDGRVLCYAE
ncbi:MAG: PQQ-binding-like beta-propeller repeat protein [Phycisphaerae bacterium]